MLYYPSDETKSFFTLYPAWSRWVTYRGCCSRSDGPRTWG